MHKETLENVSMDLIDDPGVPMRTAMDEEKLDELARSIRTEGVIQPIVLRKVGARYEVVAGHRRLTASRRAGLAVIPSVVRVLDDAAADAVRMHENLYREDINPVDEARYIRTMVDKHGVEPAKLAEMTGKSEAYLRSRYDLLGYPDYLVAAVQNGYVSLTAATWLVKITDELVRREYTRFASIGGITAKRAEAWYRSWEAGALPREASAFVAPLEPTSAEPRIISMPCVLCRHDDDIQNMTMQYAHLDCVRAVETMQKERTAEGEQVRPEAPSV